MNKEIVRDIDLGMEFLELNEVELCQELSIPRSSLNNWRNENVVISNMQYEKIYSFFYDSGLRINNLKTQLRKDLENENKVVLFHGAKQDLRGELNLAYSKDGNDFGKGFYLGMDYNQSATFVSNNPCSSVYLIEYNKKLKLKQKVFNVDEDWMLTIAYFRGRLKEYKDSKRIKDLINDIKKYDLVIAPIADNNMYQIIDDFINGIITNLQCINSLSASDLGKQYVFLSDKSLKSLEVKERCYMCDKERQYYDDMKSLNSENGRQKVKYIMRKYAGKGKYIEELL